MISNHEKEIEGSGAEEDDFLSDYNVPDFLQIHESDWTKLILKEKALHYFFTRLVFVSFLFTKLNDL